MIHVHVRDDADGHTLSVDRYRHALAAIESAVGDALIVQVTSEACGIYTATEQMAMVRELQPEAVSVALGELCPDDDMVDEAAAFYAWMQNAGVLAQHILYSPDDVRRFETLRENGVIPDRRPFVLFVLGRYASDLTGNAEDLDEFVAEVAADTVWAVCCFGETEQRAVARSARAGGHARVGFENNLQLPGGAVAEDNAAMIRLAVDSGRSAGREPASAAAVRDLFR